MIVLCAILKDIKIFTRLRSWSTAKSIQRRDRAQSGRLTSDRGRGAARAHTARQTIHHCRYLWQINPVQTPLPLTDQRWWYIYANDLITVRGSFSSVGGAQSYPNVTFTNRPAPGTSRFPIYFLLRLADPADRHRNREIDLMGSVICMSILVAA